MKSHLNLAAMQRTITLALGVILSVTTALATSTGFTVEQHATSEYGTTYRVYATFDDPGDWVSSVYGIAGDEAISTGTNIPMSIMREGTATIYHTVNAFGLNPNYGQEINALYAMLPDIDFDSWLTIGAENNSSPGPQGAGMAEAFTTFNQGIGFEDCGGAWFVAGSTPNPAWEAGDDLKVLVAQITMTDDASGNPGHFSFQLNLQWKDASGTAFYFIGDQMSSSDFVASVVPGCTDSSACNYSAAATEDDGSCEFTSCLGCTDSAACNYDASATIDNGQCVIPVTADCEVCNGSAISVLDADGDGVCDGDEITGCTDEAACNYDATPTTDTDNALCNYADGACEICSGGAVVLQDDDQDGVCNADEIGGCTDQGACNFSASATDDDGSCEFASCAGCTNNQACNYDETATLDDGSCDLITCYGCTDSGACNYTAGATQDDGSCEFTSCAGCTDADACNYDATATIDDGQCAVPDAAACEVCNGDAVIVLDADGDGVCDADESTGCTDATACNYDSNPTTDPDNATCVYADDACEICLGGAVVLQDADGDGVCDSAEVDGCTDQGACNFNGNATDDDGSCEFASCAGCLDPMACNFDAVWTIADNDACDFTSCLGCTDDQACNYDNTATIDDGSCESLSCVGCTDDSACNYAASATNDDGSCTYAAEFYDCDGNCVNDSDQDGICDELEIPGCGDAAACNYNSAATEEDDCVYPPVNGDCNTECEGDFDGDGVCDNLEVAGCTSSTATNYNESATDENGTCVWDDPHFTGLTYEIVGHSTVGEATTYRVYAEFNSDDIEIQACYGTDVWNWNATSTAPFYQNQFGGLLGHSINDAIFASIPELAFDSWFALGAGPGDEPGPAAVGLTDFTSDFEASGAGVSVNTNVGASIYYTPGASDFAHPQSGRVLVGQFTTTGVVSVKFNFQYRDTNLATFNVNDLNLTFPANLPGCTDAAACNYDAAAEFSTNDACTYATGCDSCSGATDGTGTIIDGDEDDDGVCDVNEVPGCDDDSAANYNPEATDNDGSCLYGECNDPLACNYVEGTDLPSPEACTYPAPFFDCDGNCTGDYDGDGICEGEEILGCASNSALNFNPAATSDDGSCIWGDGVFLGLTYEVVTDHETGPIAGNDYVTYRVFAEFSTSDIDLVQLFGNAEHPWVIENTGDVFQSAVGGDFGGNIPLALFSFFPEVEYDSWLTIGAAPGDYNAMNQSGMYAYLPEWNATGTFNANGAEALISVTPTQSTQGVPDADGRVLLAQITTNGVAHVQYNILFQPEVGAPITFTDVELTFPTQVAGCTNPTALNYEPNANSDDGSCTVEGCTNESAQNYNPDANIEDGSCEFAGCTDDAADNYDANANVDDDSCLYTGCTDDTADNFDPQANTGDPAEQCDYLGCTNPLAINFDEGANVDDGSCLIVGCFNPEASNYNPAANHGNQLVLCLFLGCTDPAAVNYDPSANSNDGSCDYLGCTSITADNFNPMATIDDGSCFWFGCTDQDADNYDEQATIDDDSCEFTGCFDPAADNFDLFANVGDQDELCEYWGCMDVDADNYDPTANAGDQEALCIYLGCTDETADNFDPQANEDDGLCEYLGCTDSDADNFDPTANVDDGSCIYLGCTTLGADNFDSMANQDDGSCLFSGCQDPEADNYDETANTGDQEALCEYLGCTNPDADNFDLTANTDDGSCIVGGCMYIDAANFNMAATYDDGTCQFQTVGCTDPTAYNYMEGALQDNGTCLYGGCTYDIAFNFDADATIDDGSCEWYGCTDTDAVNFDADATHDDGTCEVVGCLDPDGINFNANATFSGYCEYADVCPGDINGDLSVDVQDLLTFFQYYGTFCE